MAEKRFNMTWMRQYLVNGTYIGSGNPIRVGATQGYHSFVGFPDQDILNAIVTSTTPVKVFLNIYVTDSAYFELGVHREKNTQASGLPWYTYFYYTGWHPDNAWAKIDITNLRILGTDYAGYENVIRLGYGGLVLYQGDKNNLGVAYGVTNDSFNAYISVEGTWNTPPSAPVITAPKANEVIPGTYTLKANPSSDAQTSQSQLRYEWSIRTTGEFFQQQPLTAPGVTNLTVDFSKFAESTKAQVAVRAFDGELYSPWTYSEVFTVRHNKAPSVPVITAPKLNEVIKGTYTLKANPSVDDYTLQNQLRYQWAIKTDTDPYFIAHPIQAPGVTTYTVDFSKLSESTQAQVAVRAYDGSLYSNYAQSPVFTISHNQPPGKATVNSPKNGALVNRENAVTFSWNHVDSDAQSAYEIHWKLQGAESYEKPGIISSNKKTHTFAANTFPLGTIEWRVRTYDTEGLASSWSNVEVFVSTVRTAKPTITYPAKGETVRNSIIAVSWDAPEQDEYQLSLMRVLSSGEQQLIYESIERSSIQYLELPIELENFSTYILELQTIKDGKVLSSLESVQFNVDFSPPATPELQFYENLELGAIQLKVTNPTIEDLPPIVMNEIYKRKVNTNDPFKLIAKLKPPLATFVDYEVGSNEYYQYFVIARSDIETTAQSVITQASVKLNHTYLHRADFLGEQVRLLYNPSRSQSLGLNRKLLEFNGRESPVAEFGRIKDHNFSISFDIRTDQDLEEFLNVANYQRVLLYRDTRGAIEYITLDNISIRDKQPRGYTISATLNKTSYSMIAPTLDIDSIPANYPVFPEFPKDIPTTVPDTIAPDNNIIVAPIDIFSEEDLKRNALALTSLYETSTDYPYNFGVTAGNFDGAGLSHGAIQFNFGSGTLQPIWRDLINQHPDVVKSALSNKWDYDYFADLILNKTKADQVAFGDRITDQTNKHKVVEPWNTYFRNLGITQESINRQMVAAEWYYGETIKWFNEFNLFSRRGYALLFDIAVQSGGISQAVKDLIFADFAAINTTGKTKEQIETEKMIIIANRRADAVSSEWRESYRQRKLSIANGSGWVYGGTLFMDTTKYQMTLEPAFSSVLT